MRNFKRRKIQDRSINFVDFTLSRDYSVGEMSKYLKQTYDIDFYHTELKILKGKAIVCEDYLIDIACDIKELLSDDGQDKYFYIDTLLTEFKNNKKELK